MTILFYEPFAQLKKLRKFTGQLRKFISNLLMKTSLIIGSSNTEIANWGHSVSVFFDTEFFCESSNT